MDVNASVTDWIWWMFAQGRKLPTFQGEEPVFTDLRHEARTQPVAAGRGDVAVGRSFPLAI